MRVALAEAAPVRAHGLDGGVAVRAAAAGGEVVVAVAAVFGRRHHRARGRGEALAEEGLPELVDARALGGEAVEPGRGGEHAGGLLVAGVLDPGGGVGQRHVGHQARVGGRGGLPHRGALVLPVELRERAVHHAAPGGEDVEVVLVAAEHGVHQLQRLLVDGRDARVVNGPAARLAAPAAHAAATGAVGEEAGRSRSSPSSTG